MKQVYEIETFKNSVTGDEFVIRTNGGYEIVSSDRLTVGYLEETKSLVVELVKFEGQYVVPLISLGRERKFRYIDNLIKGNIISL